MGLAWGRFPVATSAQKKHRGVMAVKDISRITFEFPTHLLPDIDRVAKERGLTRTGLIRQGLGLMTASHKAQKDGLFTGIARDRDKLDTLFIPLV